MLPNYSDIKSRISEEPIWYDEHGVPRYDKFNPEMLGIYDDMAIYYRIACQACDKEFLVAEGITLMQRMKSKWLQAGLAALNYEHNGMTLESIKAEAEPYETDKLKAAISYGMNTPHYGDPPRHIPEDGVRCAGETMNCIDLEILEFWINESFNGWKRYPEYEGVIPEENQ